MTVAVITDSAAALPTDLATGADIAVVPMWLTWRGRPEPEGTRPLVSEDIADILVWVASRPEHVNIDELIVKPTDQAAFHKLHRRKAS